MFHLTHLESMPVFVINTPAHTNEYTLSPPREDLARLPLGYPVFNSHEASGDKGGMVRLSGGRIDTPPHPPHDMTAGGLSQQGKYMNGRSSSLGKEREGTGCLFVAGRIKISVFKIHSLLYRYPNIPILSLRILPSLSNA